MEVTIGVHQRPVSISVYRIPEDAVDGLMSHPDVVDWREALGNLVVGVSVSAHPCNITPEKNGLLALKIAAEIPPEDRAIDAVQALLFSAYLVKINGRNVPVVATRGVSDKLLAAAIESPKFQRWAQTMDPSLVVHHVLIQAVDMFGPKVGFIKMVARITKNDLPVPGGVFIRGDSVGILVVLRCNGQKHLLLTVQPRGPVGSGAFIEIPAGMIDDGGTFTGQAATEIGQETEIVITEADLIDFTALYASSAQKADAGVAYALSPGGSDERMRFFLFQKDVTPEELAALQGKATGVLEENEQITLAVRPLDRSARLIPDAKTQVALGFYAEFEAIEAVMGQFPFGAR